MTLCGWYQELLGLLGAGPLDPNPLSSLTWLKADFGELQCVHDAMRVRLTPDFFGGSGSEVDRKRFNLVIAKIRLGRLRNSLIVLEPDAPRPDDPWSPLAAVVIETYGAIWSRAMEERFPLATRIADLEPGEFCDHIREMVLASHCSAEHPLFAFLAEDADSGALARVLQAENLCDLNFANFISYLIPGADGAPAAELARNFWDEMGLGKVDLFHRNLRLDMMRAVGLETQGAPDSLADCLPEEIEHFNAYALNSTIRRNSLRLVGMLFATEFLVPQQLSAVIRGWQRVGRPDTDLKYLFEHYNGDSVHANGWVENVIMPSITHNYLAQREIFIGVRQHLDILGRLYDRILEQVR
jgi:pyrroloquinoline quinone (PQQ) biosynthesis protein C